MDGALLETMRTALRGPVIGPDDQEYGQARTVYNAMIDKAPALVLRCADVADVLAGVRFAREQHLDLAVRGGGHNGGGLGTCDGGLVLDLGGMTGVHVDPATLEQTDAADDTLVTDELLVEEISIDGMCGVY